MKFTQNYLETVNYRCYEYCEIREQFLFSVLLCNTVNLFQGLSKGEVPTAFLRYRAFNHHETTPTVSPNTTSDHHTIPLKETDLVAVLEYAEEDRARQ